MKPPHKSCAGQGIRSKGLEDLSDLSLSSSETKRRTIRVPAVAETAPAHED